MRRSTRILGMAVVAALLTGAAVEVARAAALPPPDDRYVAGYAGAVLEREFRIDPRAVTVHAGVLTLDGARLAGADRAAVLGALATLPGVVRVEVREPATGPAPPPETPAGVVTPLPTGLLPTGHLFQPLLADPRWPHFSAAYRYYLDNSDLRSVSAVSFGETIPLYRGAGFADSQWELGVQAGVFALFDIDTESKDLLNADYLVAAYGAWRRGPFSAMGRVFHQSSHLGDELLLRSRIERVNLSYESVDAKVSYDLPWGLRLYAGGGYLFDQDPESLKPWSVQGGAEFRSPWKLAAGWIRPVAAVDLQSREENQWTLDVSMRAGIQFENVRVLERNLQLLFEYFSGNSPDGQFYKNRVEYLGLGIHFHF